jgi:hypothetical protein
MIDATIHHPIPAGRNVFHTIRGQMGQLDLNAEKDDTLPEARGFVTREEALALAEAFAELAIDIEGAETIAALAKGDAA